MTYKPTPKVLDIEVFPQGFNSMAWSNMYRMTYNLEAVDASNIGHVRTQNTIGALYANNTWGLPNGTYKLTFEFAQKWDVTQTNTISNLKNATLSKFSGNGSMSVLHDRTKIECYDTGRTVSTGYNILYFRVEHYVTISGVPAGQVGIMPHYYASSSITSGLYMPTFSQYKRRFRAELIEDVTI